jgi:hypothetical protein
MISAMRAQVTTAAISARERGLVGAWALEVWVGSDGFEAATGVIVGLAVGRGFEADESDLEATAAD